MIKKIVLFVALLFCSAAHAGPMVNVEYIHSAIKKHWGIEVPYNPALQNPLVAANMKYLLTAVDRANQIINGEEITDYGNGEYATQAAADTIATDDAVARLIKKQLPPFVITTTPTTTSFNFTISARGDFIVDWGDGETESLSRPKTSSASTLSHTYATAGEYKIKITGQATAYSRDGETAAISFSNAPIARVDGSLGSVFPTIGDGSAAGQQPRFFQTFYKCTSLTEIPDDLFAGISGAPVNGMFQYTFLGCSSLTEIPAGLFSGITGPAASYMFSSTFYGCSGLTEIPEGLFSTITGQAAENMFNSTFSACTSLTEIPSDLFSTITGPAASNMFSYTFSSCSSLREIPEGLFSSIEGPAAENMFNSTFYGCRSLTEIPSDLFAGITGPAATSMFRFTFEYCRSLTEIPSDLFAGITGPAAKEMFFFTFGGCTNLSKIPAGLFSSITGPAARGMFEGTFSGCSNLSSIPENLFDDFSGSSAERMFNNTFAGCSKLSGPSARINGKYLYEIWPDATRDQVVACYYKATGLSDYSSIPANWK